MSFLIGVSILFFVRSFAGNRERDMLYLFASLVIIFTILSPIIEIIINPTIFQPTILYPTYIFYISFEVITLCIWFLAFFAYWRLFKSFGTDNTYTLKTTNKFIPRIQPIAEYGYKFYTKPMVAFIIILIIAIIMGSAMSISLSSVLPSSSSDSTGGSDYPNNYIDSDFMEGHLTEGDSTEETWNLEYDIIQIRVLLAWQDEEYINYHINQPDRFTLDVNCDGQSETETAENTHGSEGMIEIDLEYDPVVGEYKEILIVTVTLDTAGDQVGPLGITGSPFTVEDNSNEYMVLIDYEFYE